MGNDIYAPVFSSFNRDYLVARSVYLQLKFIRTAETTMHALQQNSRTLASDSNSLYWIYARCAEICLAQIVVVVVLQES